MDISVYCHSAMTVWIANTEHEVSFLNRIINNKFKQLFYTGLVMLRN